MDAANSCGCSNPTQCPAHAAGETFVESIRGKLEFPGFPAGVEYCLGRTCPVAIDAPEDRGDWIWDE